MKVYIIGAGPGDPRLVTLRAAELIARCPVVRHRMRHALGEATNQVLSDFSYTCRPIAGPGYFLVGDAGALELTPP